MLMTAEIFRGTELGHTNTEAGFGNLAGLERAIYLCGQDYLATHLFIRFLSSFQEK